MIWSWLGALDEHGVEEDVGTKVFEAVFRLGGDGVASYDGSLARWDEELEVLAVGDHVEGLGAHDGNEQENAEELRLAHEDVAGEAERLCLFALEATAGGGGDFDSRIEGLDGVVAGRKLLGHDVQRGADDDIGDASLGDVAGVGEASRQRGEHADHPQRQGLSYLHAHEA